MSCGSRPAPNLLFLRRKSPKPERRSSCSSHPVSRGSGRRSHSELLPVCNCFPRDNKNSQMPTPVCTVTVFTLRGSFFIFLIMCSSEAHSLLQRFFSFCPYEESVSFLQCLLLHHKGGQLKCESRVE